MVRCDSGDIFLIYINLNFESAVKLPPDIYKKLYKFQPHYRRKGAGWMKQ